MASNATNSTTHELSPNIPYMACEILVAVCAVIGNALVILVFCRERRLRRRTNYYIVSLAIADLLVGLLGIPFAILASLGLPTNLHACLFTVSLLVVLCTISIFCLVAVSVDRYWAILHPMGYSRNVRTKTAIAIIGVCWISGTLVGLLPLFGWHRSQPAEGMKCLFTEVMDYDYLLFLYFATIVVPALLLAAFYAHIYRVVLNQVQIVTMNPSGGCTPASGSGGTMLRMLGPVQKREVKATQNLSIIVLFFIICWIPLYTINCVMAFCQDCFIPLELTNFCIILSHANSAVNPLLYAYHLRDFRAALKNLLCCLFGNKGDNRRFGSHTFHQHGVNTPTRNNSMQSLQQIRAPQHLQLYPDFPTVTSKIASSSSTASGLNAPLPLRTVIANMNSIHQVITDLPLGEDTADDRRGRKRMWTLTEVSSACEDDKPASNGHLALEHNGDSCVQRRSGTNRTSGQVNSAYIEDAIVLDYGEDDDDDDDVFLSETIATLSPNRTGFSENIVAENRTEIIRSFGKLLVTDQPKEQFELSVRQRRSVSSRHSADKDFPECSSQLHWPCSLIVDNVDISNSSLDDHDKTELSPSRCRMKEVIVANSDGITCNGARVLRLGSENRVDKPEISENNRSSTNSENQRLSPLKIMGEFLFHTNKSTLLKEEVLDEPCMLLTKDVESKDSCDSQRLQDSDTGSVSHICEVTKHLDDMMT
ncbi:hypothetical protein L798_01328 [Zootermopsis nevadensis]|uniref:G-protein coupled receptors family 1 profile domain-containing protein n=1 Tax=Zootermopsis nevadensis TaxID=136037 RepID=A0A067QW88_ZOONE|nr:hypothetical protein L798_01328 [Zootermopsis nevadensis]